MKHDVIQAIDTAIEARPWLMRNVPGTFDANGTRWLCVTGPRLEDVLEVVVRVKEDWPEMVPWNVRNARDIDTWRKERITEITAAEEDMAQAEFAKKIAANLESRHDALAFVAALSTITSAQANALLSEASHNAILREFGDLPTKKDRSI
jgi:hypothetical protein